MDARDVAEAAATRAAAPFMAKAGCIGAALAVIGMLGLGTATLIAGAAKKAADGKGGGARCEAPGLPDPVNLGNVPGPILAQQIHHAKIIDGVAQERGLPGRASLIALMTALQESGLQNLDRGDRDSLGLFQQRPSQGWGTPAEVTDPPKAAGLFFGGNPGRPPGLVDIPAWPMLEPGLAAQRVQRSAYPHLYATRRGQAEGVARNAGINLERFGSVKGELPEWAQPTGPGEPAPGECTPAGETPVGAPFHDAASDWPPKVKNRRSTEAAIAWAKEQPALNQKIWYRRCLEFAARVHGWRAAGVVSAITHYHVMPAHMKHPGSRDVPPGALMYWETGNPHGHVSVYLGDGMIISNDVARPGYVDVIPASDIESKWGGRYVGWAPPISRKGPEMRTPGSVPATPLYALMIRTDQAHGLALTLDGEQIAAGPDIEALRASGLAELRVRAALAGRPVRARAVEPASPIPWNMIVSPDGTVVDVAEHPAAPAPVTEDNRLEPADSRGTPEAEPSAPPARTAADASAQAALPALLGSEAYREMWAAAWAAHRTGDLPAAVALAYKLETTLVEQVGDMHPATVTVLTARAWLTLCQRTELRETTELLIVTALRCRATRYRPEADTIRTARNAHACWHLLRKESPEQAAALAGRLADMLAILGEDDRRRDVLTWNGVLPAG